MGVHKYNNDEITVTWDSDTCIHAAVCVGNLKSVFNPDNRPWINVDAASKQEIMDVIKKCPSGALAYETADGETSEKGDDAAEIKIVAANNGPYLVKGTVFFEDGDGNPIGTKKNAALCRCGASSNKPFCDGSHKGIEFQA